MSENLPWQALAVICDGQSIIDTPKLELKSEAEAHQFALTYGYDLHEPTHTEQVWKIFEEAKVFLEDSLRHKLPDHLNKRESFKDFKEVLLIASGVARLEDAKAKGHICALLRVMHAVAHLRNDLRLKYIVKIRKQTIGRLEAHVQKTSENGKEEIFLGFERDKIRLLKFETKTGKNRESVILKLLQRAESVAQEIYDHVGVRFVTKTKVEALLVVKYLLDHHLISVANVMTARCRNNLVSLADFKREFEKLGSTPLTEEMIQTIEKKMNFPDGPKGADNPFSSNKYRSLQFTSRPLIRIPVLKKGGLRAEISFFFPLEVQVLDETSYFASQEGAASHDQYKEKQLEAARKRVLRGVPV